MTRIPVLGMRRIKADGQTKRLIRPLTHMAVEEIDNLVTRDVREVSDIPISLSNFITFIRPVFVVVKVVEHSVDATLIFQRWLDSICSNTKLADESGPVSRRFQQRRIAVVGKFGSKWRREKGELMTPLVHSCQIARPARRADRRGCESVAKPYTAHRQAIDVRRVDDRVAGATEEICALVIGKDEKYVWRHFLNN